MNKRPRICDYGDSSYRQDFWEGQGRDYEDAVERGVLRKLLPPTGRRLLEIGAGFGRLTDEYTMFEQVVLLDYSLEQLQFARRRYGVDGYMYVAADAYRMPFRPAVFDAATMIRVLHHFEDVPAVLHEISRVLAKDSKFILEFANKRNLKAMLRHMAGRNGWSPYTLDPIEFVELNFNFHPDYMARQWRASGFRLRQTVPVSWFRLGLLKRALPTALLARLDAAMQRTGWALSPSIFLDLVAARGDRVNAGKEDPYSILQCPASGTALRRDGDELVSATGVRWAISGGVFDFRQPLA